MRQYNSYIRINGKILEDLNIYNSDLRETVRLTKEKANEFYKNNDYKEIEYVVILGKKGRNKTFIPSKEIFYKTIFRAR